MYKNGLCTFGIFCFHQQRVCIFKTTADLLQPPNPHGLFPLRRMTRLSFKYCQGFSGSGSSVLSLSLPLDIYSRLLFIFRHLWWRCQWFYCTWVRHLLFIAFFSSSKGPREHWDEWECTHLIKTSASTVKNRWMRREKEFFFMQNSWNYTFGRFSEH